MSKLPRQAPDGVSFRVSNGTEKADKAGKRTVSYARADVEARKGVVLSNSAELRGWAEVTRNGALAGTPVAKAVDPWIFTPDTDSELTLDVDLDIDLSADLSSSGDSCTRPIAQIEACGSFYCVDREGSDPLVTWDYTKSVGPGESYQGSEALVSGQTVFLQSGKTYKLVADLVNAADASGVCPDPVQD